MFSHVQNVAREHSAKQLRFTSKVLYHFYLTLICLVRKPGPLSCLLFSLTFLQIRQLTLGEDILCFDTDNQICGGHCTASSYSYHK